MDQCPCQWEGLAQEVLWILCQVLALADPMVLIVLMEVLLAPLKVEISHWVHLPTLVTPVAIPAQLLVDTLAPVQPTPLPPAQPSLAMGLGRPVPVLATLHFEDPALHIPAWEDQVLLIQDLEDPVQHIQAWEDRAQHILEWEVHLAWVDLVLWVVTQSTHPINQ